MSRLYNALYQMPLPACFQVCARTDYSVLRAAPFG